MKVDENYFRTDNPMKENSIEDILSEDEQVLVRLKPNKKALVLESVFKGLPIALLWGAIDIGFIIMMVFTGAFEEQPSLLAIIIPFFAIHLFPLWAWIAGIIKTAAGCKNLEYVFTEKRVIIRSGIIGIDFKNIYYSDITEVNVKVGILDRMFKIGDLCIKTNDQAAVLDNIERPYFYLQKIHEITLDLKSDINYPNDLRPEENHGYNTKYKK